MPRVRAMLQQAGRGAAAAATKPAEGTIGKVACTKNFHCVKASDAAVFYKILAQLR
jgi:hypothetical protein